jgi:hypothetical protein
MTVSLSKKHQTKISDDKTKPAHNEHINIPQGVKIRIGGGDIFNLSDGMNFRCTGITQDKCPNSFHNTLQRKKRHEKPTDQASHMWIWPTNPNNHQSCLFFRGTRSWESPPEFETFPVVSGQCLFSSRT